MPTKKTLARDYAFYQVAIKVLLRKGDEVLMLRTHDGELDYPGGRIDTVEGEVPLMEILAREIREEIGKNVKYKIGRPLFQFRRFHKQKYILQTVYEGEYLGGEPTLSEEHEKWFWLNPKTHQFKPREFCSREEYEAATKYFREEF